jgi:hypothetical protein
MNHTQEANDSDGIGNTKNQLLQNDILLCRREKKKKKKKKKKKTNKNNNNNQATYYGLKVQWTLKWPHEL